MFGKCLVCFFLLLFSAAPTAGGPLREFSGQFVPADNGERLLLVLASLFDPEVLELRMDEPPNDAGKIRNLSVLIKGVSFLGFRIEKISIESSFVELTPPSAWRTGRRRSLTAGSALRTNLEIVVLERDINATLGSYAAGENRIAVELKPGEIEARANYRTKSHRFDILAEVSTGLEIRNGKQVWLKDPRLSINHADQTEIIMSDLLKIQPLVDFGEFPLPVTLALIAVDEDTVRLSTKTPPGPVEGVLYRYVRNSEEPLSAGHDDIFSYSSDQFQNGDILFVNGKTWRSKVVSLLEKSPAGFSHVGMIRMVEGVPHVLHASPEAEKVLLEPLREFLSSARVDYAGVYRLMGDPDRAETASRIALKYVSKETLFDKRFDISNEDALYCTELIWRAYKEAGVDLAGGGWKNLDNPIVQGRVLFPYALSRSQHLVKVSILD